MELQDLNNIESWFETEEGLKISMFSFKDFYSNVKIIEDGGYKFVGEANLTYEFVKDKKLSLSIATGKEDLETQMPDYNDSMVNITASIAKYYGKESTYKSMDDLDIYLHKKRYKHVFFLILDGLAPYIVDKCLDKEDFLKKYNQRNISAVFPSTTACSIPCSTSGKLSTETGWLGWENYFKELKLDLVLFTGTNYITGNPTGINVRKDYLPYDDYFASFDVEVFDLEPAFKPNGFEDFKGMANKMVEISKHQKDTFAYCYWDEPDGTLHDTGTDSKASYDVIRDLSKTLDSIKDKLGDDSILIITADHGHQNVHPIFLYEFEDIISLLKHTPSNEGRCLCFEVSEDKHQEFKDLFNKYFSSLYDLYTKEDFINKGFLSDENHRNINPRLNEFLGDYIAVAKSNYYFQYVEKDFVFKSAHAGLTKNEMETPLIIFSK